jgi:hypothetical protein
MAWKSNNFIYLFGYNSLKLCLQGPLHGLPVSTPYMTKDYLETKRSKALALETTFVYDYPDLFKVNLKDIWKEHVTKCSAPGYISFFNLLSNLSNLSTVVCSLLTSFSFTLH